MNDDLIEASDGLPARASGEWAQEKLFYVGKYMEIFSTGQKYKWPVRAYLDLMAGPGLCKLRGAGDEFPGSPLLALGTKTPFTHAVFVELDGELAAALSSRSQGVKLRPLPTAITGDCNNFAVLQAIAKALPTNALTLAFVDMLGLDVAFSTLNALTAGRRIDLAITFQVQDLVRNVPSALIAGGDLRLDRFFGTAGWMDRLTGVLPAGYAAALTEFYLDRLKTLGYDYSDQLQVPMKNSKNAPLYRLLMASKHSRAVDYFRKISTIEYSGQRAMFRMDG